MISLYCIAGKFGGFKIWRICLKMHLVVFKFGGLPHRAMTQSLAEMEDRTIYFRIRQSCLVTKRFGRPQGRTPQPRVGYGEYGGPLHTALLVCLRILAIGLKWPHALVHLLCVSFESCAMLTHTGPSFRRHLNRTIQDSNRTKTLATTRSHAHRIHGYM